MGREVKMVDSKFDWPIRKIWKGYLNPYYEYSKQCAFCEGTGLNAATKKIRDDWYGLPDYDKDRRWSDKLTQYEVDALIKAGRLYEFTHIWVENKKKGRNEWVRRKDKYIPTAEEINEWSIKSIMGHDGINQWICVKARAKRLKVYGHCEYCKGEGTIWLSNKYKRLYDRWKSYNPPSGKWYQMWETTSEGSPISPPFETPIQLATWLVDNAASSFGSNTATFDQWMNMILGDKWCMDMISDGNSNFKMGVETCNNVEKNKCQEMMPLKKWALENMWWMIWLVIVSIAWVLFWLIQWIKI